MSVCYIRLEDIKKIDIMNIQGGMTGTKVKNKLEPDYLVNLALYDMNTGTNITNLEDENVQSGYLFSSSGIGIKGSKELVWTRKDEAYSSNDIRDYVSGSPVLIVDNKINIDWGNKYSSYVDGKHKRTAIGFNSTYLILYSTDDECSIQTLASRMLSYGCTWAINCDGGGSQYLQKGTKVLKYSYRKNVSWLLVWMKEKENFAMYKYQNNSNKRLPVYETTECKKKIGSLDPYEICDCLYESLGYKVVLYNITGKSIKKVGFIKE